jgi:hypothetical protein
MAQYVESGDVNGVLVANAAFNSLRKDTAKHRAESNRKRSNVKDRSATDSVMDSATRMSLFKVPPLPPPFFFSSVVVLLLLLTSY